MTLPRILFTALLSAAALFGSVTCKTTNDTTGNGTWTRGSADLAHNGTVTVVVSNDYRWGSCSGATHPVHYIIASSGETSSQMSQQVQAVYNDAHLGDSVVFTAGTTFDWRATVSITTRPGSGYLTTTTSAHAKLPNSGTRITPAYRDILAEIRQYSSSTAPLSSGITPFQIYGDHLWFEGVWFNSYNNGDPFQWTAQQPHMIMGGGQVCTGCAARGSISNSTATVALAATTMTVVNTDGFTVTTPPQRVTIGGRANHVYQITGVTPSTRTITFCREDTTSGTLNAHDCVAGGIDQTGIANGSGVYLVHNRDGDYAYMPDDIVLSHCVVGTSSIPRVEKSSGLFILEARAFTFKDSWSEIFSTYNAEPKHFYASSGYGPFTFQNNFFLNGMAVMTGGGTNATNTDFAGGSTWRYNAFSLPPELTGMGNWSESVAEGSRRIYTLMPIPGLPEHSARYVVAGRAITERSTLANGYWWTATNTGVAGLTKPACFATTSTLGAYCYDGDSTRPGTTVCGDATSHAGDGVCWRLNTGTWHSMTKNAWETKNGSNILLQYNVFDAFPDVATYNTNQHAVINVKDSSLYHSDTINYPGVTFGCTTTLGVSTTWPACDRGWALTISFRNNWLKDVFSGFDLKGYYDPGSGGARGVRAGQWTIDGNLITLRGPGSSLSYSCINANTNADDPGVSITARVPLEWVKITNNTCYAPFVPPVGQAASIQLGTWIPTSWGTWSNANTYAGFGGGTENVMKGNIYPRWGTASVATPQSWNPAEGKLIANWFPRTLNGGIWGKNVVVGGAATDPVLGAYPTGTAYSGCKDASNTFAPSTNPTPCAGTTALGAPDYSKTLVNPTVGDFRVKNVHTFAKRGNGDGMDIGADPDQIPMIQGLKVTPTDRSVLFQWRLTPIIADIPCVVELHTSPDLESTSYAGSSTGYAAELSNIGTYYRQDADDTDRNYRDGNRRMLVLGHTIHLSASTQYYYRLHCGGDVVVGSFATLGTLSSTSTQSIARTATTATTASMLVEYGTAYSRGSDVISSGGSSTVSCALGQRCVVSFPATRGTIVYYRWTEQDAANAALNSGNVDVIAVP